MLPKGAYVVQIKRAKQEANKSGSGSHLAIAFDIAEGEYANIYAKQFESNPNEDKKWPNDAVFYLTVPEDGCKEYIWENWNTFFADLEDSNNGFVFGGDVKQLQGKLIGGKFNNEQSEYNGKIYDHTKLKWTCVADDVRHGKAGKMPNDKLVAQSTPSATGSALDQWTNVPEGADDEIPF
jgi:hypothetical protein